MAAALPSSARCVVVGGGVAGTSVAYHLARKPAWKDTLLLERDQLTSGTTWHAAGLMGRIAGSKRVTKMRRYGAEIYQQLAAETGMDTGFAQQGGLTIATTPERLALLHRWAQNARAVGTNCWVISADEVRARAPVINCDDVLGALWSPDDGQINPVDCTMVMAAAAKREGANVVEHTPVTAVLTDDDGAVCGVQTERGVVHCEKVVLAGGMWSQQLAADAGASLPLWPCEHEYVLTDSMPECAGMPVVRSYDEYTYIKQDAGRMLIGFFEPNAKVAFADEPRVPEDFSFGSFPDDLEHLSPYLELAMHRVPLLQSRVGIQSYFAGPESFTPDGTELLGELPEVPGLYVCAGFNSHGIVCGPAAGSLVADCVDDGGLGFKRDWFAMDVRRLQRFMAQTDWIKPRASETLGRQYGMTYPFQHHRTGRDHRTLPFHQSMAARGACFGTAGGYERPEFFGPPGSAPELAESWGEQTWHPYTAAECLAARTGAALFDQSSLTKLIVEGPDAAQALQWVCSAHVARPRGRCAYTLLLNSAGGIESDGVVTRLGDDKFMYMSGSAMRVKDKHWIERAAAAAPAGSALDFSVIDVTDDVAVLGVFGPRAPALLTAATGVGFSDAQMPNGSVTEVELSEQVGAVLAVRTAYAGDVGWELHVPTERAQALYDCIVGVGEADYGLVHAGVHALDALRVEAGHLRWGSDISAAETPADVGLAFAVSKKKSAFMGKEALDQAAAAGPSGVRIAMYSVPAGVPYAVGEPLVLAGDPVHDAAGEVLGEVTSSVYTCHGKLLVMVLLASSRPGPMPAVAQLPVPDPEAAPLPLELQSEE